MLNCLAILLVRVSVPWFRLLIVLNLIHILGLDERVLQKSESSALLSHLHCFRI